MISSSGQIIAERLYFSGASVDNTNLYKSCAKALKEQKKDVFPITDQKSQLIAEEENEISKKKSITEFFLKIREIQDNITRHKQLLNDHRKRYLGQMTDPSTMSQEECVYMDKIIANNLKSVEQQLVNIESKINAKNLHSLKKIAFANSRIDSSICNSVDKSNTDMENCSLEDLSSIVTQSNIEACKAFAIIITRANLLELSSFFAQMKENRNHKQSVKAKLMRLHRPTSIKKSNEEVECKLKNEDLCKDQPVTRENKKKVLGEDLRAAEAPSNQQSNSDIKSEGRSEISTGNLSSEDVPSGKISAISTSSNMAETSLRRRHVENVRENIESTLNPEECQLLEQENAMLYNELQSTHEEVKQITKQVVELGRLQSVLLESVEEQAVMADSIHDTILHATDNVQEGNEQIREAMRKDASFRVWIMVFLIVMSFTILFLDWYND